MAYGVLFRPWRYQPERSQPGQYMGIAGMFGRGRSGHRLGTRPDYVPEKGGPLMSNNDKQAKQDSTAGKAANDSGQRQGVGGGDKVAGGSGPGSDNPALAETYAEESGDISTADFLLARE